MKRLIAIFILTTITSSAIFALNNSCEFKLNGTINIDTGTVCLIFVGNERYYPKELINPTTKIIKGKFVFKGAIQYPYAFMLGVKQGSELKYISDIFYIDPIEQNLQCDINKPRQRPTLINSSMNNLLKYNKFAENFKNGDISLLSYAKSHPDSYIIMWKLIEKFSYKNYSKDYDSIYQCLSPKLKSTHTGIELGKYLFMTRSLGVDSYFPKLKVKDIDKQVDFDAKTISGQYILIDFWYSSCGPCIGQFEELKRIYSLYKNGEFNIVGIANESNETIEKWITVVNKHKLPWSQYIDMNGFECKNLNINAFPSNFLINQDGKIVSTNLDPKELLDFLEKHIK